MNKSDLRPACVFEQFAKINQIPRPSKREEKMIEYLKSFGESHGLETVVDETGNVIIRKGATPGYENRETVILQSHMDMVCEKLVDIDFDFDKDAIQTYVDGEWLTAKGTTLGADDGIGCAIELAILDSNDIQHGPLECVFTRDEETGLTGAEGMQPGFMTGKMLINLDSEDEGQIFVSCAGGRNTTATFHCQREEAPEGWFFLKASLKGLVGGHSGDDINKKRGNAIKILSRFLYQTQERYGLRLVSFNGGKLHNAIPRDGVVVFGVPFEAKETSGPTGMSLQRSGRRIPCNRKEHAIRHGKHRGCRCDASGGELATGAGLASCRQRRVRHVSGRGAGLDGGNIEQHGKRGNQRRQGGGGGIAALQRDECPRQPGSHHQGRVPAGWCRRGAGRRLSRMENESRQPAHRIGREDLQGVVWKGAQGAWHTRRTGVRAVFRKISQPRHGELRTHPARRSLARREVAHSDRENGLGPSHGHPEKYSC